MPSLPALCPIQRHQWSVRWKGAFLEVPAERTYERITHFEDFKEYNPSWNLVFYSTQIAQFFLVILGFCLTESQNEKLRRLLQTKSQVSLGGKKELTSGSKKLYFVKTDTCHLKSLVTKEKPQSNISSFYLYCIVTAVSDDDPVQLWRLLQKLEQISPNKFHQIDFTK